MLRRISEELASAAQPIAQTPAGQELLNQAALLEAEAADDAGAVPDAEVLSGVAACLEAAADRLRALPLGARLSDIAGRLRAEMAKAGGGGQRAASLGARMDTSGWSVRDLRQAVARLAEEREEIQRSLQETLSIIVIIIVIMY